MQKYLKILCSMLLVVVMVITMSPTVVWVGENAQRLFVAFSSATGSAKSRKFPKWGARGATAAQNG